MNVMETLLLLGKGLFHLIENKNLMQLEILGRIDAPVSCRVIEQKIKEMKVPFAFYSTCYAS